MSALRAGSSARTAVVLASLSLALALASLLGLAFGATPVSLARAFSDPASAERAIIEARALRVLLGAVTGAALATAGCAFQALLRNPLGDPFALGVSGGAALGASVAVLLGVGAALVPAAAFVGALAACALVVALARASGAVDARALLLAGVVLNTATSAALSLLRSALPGTRAQRTLSLLLGAIGDEPPSVVATVTAVVLAGAVALWAMAKHMDLLGLGEDTAASLGVSVRRVELAVFVAGSLVVGGAVSVCGLVPFVGLVVPHYARAWVGGAHRALLVASALAGATLLVLADAAARGLFRVLSTEAPVGALTALLGAPFLFVALRKRRVDL